MTRDAVPPSVERSSVAIRLRRKDHNSALGSASEWELNCQTFALSGLSAVNSTCAVIIALILDPWQVYTTHMKNNVTKAGRIGWPFSLLCWLLLVFPAVLSFLSIIATNIRII